MTKCKACGKKSFGFEYCSQECFESHDRYEIESQGFDVPDEFECHQYHDLPDYSWGDSE